MALPAILLQITQQGSADIRIRRGSTMSFQVALTYTDTGLPIDLTDAPPLNATVAFKPTFGGASLVTMIATVAVGTAGIVTIAATAAATGGITVPATATGTQREVVAGVWDLKLIDSFSQVAHVYGGAVILVQEAS